MERPIWIVVDRSMNCVAVCMDYNTAAEIAVKLNESPDHTDYAVTVLEETCMTVAELFNANRR